MCKPDPTGSFVDSNHTSPILIADLGHLGKISMENIYYVNQPTSEPTSTWSFKTSSELDFSEIGVDLSRSNPVILMKNISDESTTTPMATLLIHHSLSSVLSDFNFNFFTIKQPDPKMVVVVFGIRNLNDAIDSLKIEYKKVNANYGERTYEVSSINIRG